MWEDDRASILARTWEAKDTLLVFDELHKRARWKQWIKGEYDINHDGHRYLVTGSARLDVYRRGGDSLLARYHHWRLHPFTLDEKPANMSSAQAFARLMTVGGFPEPFLDVDEREAWRWRVERHQRVIREDLRDLEQVRNIAGISLLVDLLRRRVGGMIVVSNLANELQVSPVTVKHWIEMLERMYVIFVIRPLAKGLGRAIVKTPKIYFYDTGDVIGDEGAKYENLVATHLLKWCHFYQDRDGYTYELHYLRDKDGHEVDFALTRDGTLFALIESKLGETVASPSLAYFSRRLRVGTAAQWVAHVPARSRHLPPAVAPAIERLRDPDSLFR